MISPFLLLLAVASAPDNQPLPPPKPEPEPEPGSRVRLSDASGREVTLDGVEWRIGVDHADPAGDRSVFSLHPNHPPTGNSMGKTLAGRGRSVARPADPEKKRARKAQKKARRARR